MSKFINGIGFAFLVLILVGVTTAQNVNISSEFSNPSYEKNKELNLKILCFDQGFPCTASVVCNLTVYYPNFSFIVPNQRMSFNTTGVYNYTITANKLSTPGDYIGYSRCVSGIGAAGEDASFRIVDILLYHGGGDMAWEIAVILFISVIVGSGITLSWMARDNLPIWMLFIFEALSMTIVGMAITRGIALAGGADAGLITLLDDSLILLFAIFAFFFVYFIMQYFKGAFEKKKDDKYSNPVF